MNPSDGGGTTPSGPGGAHDAFEVWAHIVIPALGVMAGLAAALAAVAIPIFILYGQRKSDALQLKDQRAIEEQRIREERRRADLMLREQRELAATERAHEARKRATRDAVSALAPFVGLNPFKEEMRPLLVELRTRLMALVDEYPADHPLNDLVAHQQQLGMSIARGIMAKGEPKLRANVSEREYYRQLDELINPLHGWAAKFTSDLRVIQSDSVSEETIERLAKKIAATIEQMHEKNGWEQSPPPNIRRRRPE